jgi:hypothetical protein
MQRFCDKRSANKPVRCWSASIALVRCCRTHPSSSDRAAARGRASWSRGGRNRVLPDTESAPANTKPGGAVGAEPPATGKVNTIMRKLIRLVACFALAASVFGWASVAGAAELPAEPTVTAEPESTISPEGSGEVTPLSLCSANVICIYSSKNYNNFSVAFDCSLSGAKPWAGESALNRCGNKTDWLRVNGTAIACMNPGGERPSPGFFNEVFIAAQYGAFC